MPSPMAAPIATQHPWPTDGVAAVQRSAVLAVTAHASVASWRPRAPVTSGPTPPRSRTSQPDDPLAMR